MEPGDAIRLGGAAELEKESQLPLAGEPSWYKDPLLILALGLVFSLDQITKAVVRHSLLLRESIPRDGFFRITHTSNTGGAFGIFPDQTLFLILASFVGIAILLVIYRAYILPRFPLRLSLGMQLGGALGNLIDRVRMGQVTDFFDVGPWPIFNVADASIVIGITIVAGLILFAGRGVSRRPSTAYHGYGEAAISPVMAPVAGETGSPDQANDESRGPPLDDLCPMCDAEMDEEPSGWRCGACGFEEGLEEMEPS